MIQRNKSFGVPARPAGTPCIFKGIKGLSLIHICLKLEAARSIREDYLHQNAFDEVDTYTSLNKQYLLMELILAFYDKSLEALGKGAAIEKIVAMSSRERIGRFKYADEKQTESEYNEILSELDSDIDKAVKAKDEN